MYTYRVQKISIYMKQTILIIDDSKDLRETMSDILELKGFDTLVADQGQSGIDIAFSNHPNLILLDLRMPDIDGFEVIRRIRKDEWGATAKILVLTASGEVSDIPNDINLESEDFLLKTDYGIGNISEKIKEKLKEK